jgi:hypothetical protein
MKNTSSKSTASAAPGAFPDLVSDREPQEALMALCEHLAGGPEAHATQTLQAIKSVLGVQAVVSDDGEAIEQVVTAPDFDTNETDSAGLRPMDVLCRGRDSDEACFAAVYLIQAGAEVDTQPNPSEAAPLHATAYYANWRILCTLLDMGADASITSNGAKQQLLGSTAIHALATGFRSARGQDYAECFGALLGSGCNIDAKDRKRQTAIDIAMKSSASTQDSTLVDAMLNYGVVLDGSDNRSAMAVAQAMSKRTGNHKLMAQISASAFGVVARSLDALRATEALPEPSTTPQPSP